MLRLSLIAAVLIAAATALPAADHNVTSGSDKPCCQGACCTAAGEEKYWSIAKGILGQTHCGECCMHPKDYKLYHFFEKNLTKSEVASPCLVLQSSGLAPFCFLFF